MGTTNVTESGKQASFTTILEALEDAIQFADKYDLVDIDLHTGISITYDADNKTVNRIFDSGPNALKNRRGIFIKVQKVGDKTSFSLVNILQIPIAKITTRDLKNFDYDRDTLLSGKCTSLEIHAWDTNDNLREQLPNKLRALIAESKRLYMVYGT